MNRPRQPWLVRLFKKSRKRPAI